MKKELVPLVTSVFVMPMDPPTLQVFLPLREALTLMRETVKVTGVRTPTRIQPTRAFVAMQAQETAAIQAHGTTHQWTTT